MAVAAGVGVLCVAVNDAGNWRVQDPRGWLPLLFIPEIVLLALAFGAGWGLGAGLVAGGLTVIGAVADGAALFGTADTVNLLGWLLLPMFLAVGFCYGLDRVRDRPLWLVILTVPIFPIAFVIVIVWAAVGAVPFGGGSESAKPQPPSQPDPAMVMYLRSDAQPEAGPLAGLDQLPAHPDDYQWAHQVLGDAVQRGSVDPALVRLAIDSALDHGWNLKDTLLRLDLEQETRQKLLVGFAAIDCDLAPGQGVALVEAGTATKELAENVAELWLEYERTRPGKEEPAQERIT